MTLELFFIGTVNTDPIILLGANFVPLILGANIVEAAPKKRRTLKKETTSW